MSAVMKLQGWAGGHILELAYEWLRTVDDNVGGDRKYSMLGADQKQTGRIVTGPVASESAESSLAPRFVTKLFAVCDWASSSRVCGFDCWFVRSARVDGFDAWRSPSRCVSR